MNMVITKEMKYQFYQIISNYLEKLAINLIKQNITEPLEFHIKNFNKNNINYSYNKIKNLLQKIREAGLPNNDEILSDISKIKINFNNINNHEEGVPFRLAKGKFVNLRYKNRAEKYIIFTSLYQLKLSGNSDDFFIDGTFKSSPKSYYQLLNIFGYIIKRDFYLPIANIVLSNKSYELYEKVFKVFLHFYEMYNIDINFSEKSIMCDYEKSLRAAIKNNFDKIKLRGSYFHFAKAIYKKCKYYNLFTKQKKRNNFFSIYIKNISLYPYGNERGLYK